MLGQTFGTGEHQFALTALQPRVARVEDLVAQQFGGLAKRQTTVATFERRRSGVQTQMRHQIRFARKYPMTDIALEHAFAGMRFAVQYQR